jgi:hypothetical protein
MDREGKERRYDEMWTGEWWWKTQVIPLTMLMHHVNRC